MDLETSVLILRVFLEKIRQNHKDSTLTICNSNSRPLIIRILVSDPIFSNHVSCCLL